MKLRCATAARFFREQGITAIGVCLLHSYANAAHERRVAEILAEEYPDCVVSLSCDVLPEYREYERAVTTLVDAFVKPHMGRYLKRIRDELGPGLHDKPFLVMQSSGGVASPDQVMRKPITTALSGPAAGAIGCAVIAEIAGFPDLVTLDAGGTSTDLCLIENAKPQRHQWRRGRAFSGARADDRHQDHRHRRRFDRLDHPRGPSESRPAQRRRRARTDVLSERRQRADHHRRQSRARPAAAGADRRRHRARCRARARRHRRAGARSCPAA